MISFLTNLSTAVLFSYNIRDVEGFVPAIEAMQQQWRQLDLCLINDGISLSSLAYKLMHRSVTPKNSVIWLPRRQEKFVFDAVSKAIIGKRLFFTFNTSMLLTFQVVHPFASPVFIEPVTH